MTLGCGDHLQLNKHWVARELNIWWLDFKFLHKTDSPTRKRPSNHRIKEKLRSLENIQCEEQRIWFQLRIRSWLDKQHNSSQHNDPQNTRQILRAYAIMWNVTVKSRDEHNYVRSLST